MPFQAAFEAKAWNAEVLKLGGGFLQSWEWGEFQRSLGRDVLRLGGAAARVQAVRMPLPLGQWYWYAPRGPVCSERAEESLSVLRGDARLKEALFLRFEPSAPVELPGMAKTRDVQPSRTSILDLSREPEELLAGMHPKCRYNIRLAEKKGVRVIPGPSSDDGIGVFWDLLSETTERGGFRGHARSHYAAMLRTLAGDPSVRDDKAKARLLFAEHDGKVLAAVVLLYFGGTVTYLHGASSRGRRELMAPHLLHWRAIEDARVWGYAAYDFWGVAPEGDERHPWAGLSRFKRGFGGREIEYPGTFDLILKPKWYKVYRVVQSLRGR